MLHTHFDLVVCYGLCVYKLCLSFQNCYEIKKFNIEHFQIEMSNNVISRFKQPKIYINLIVYFFNNTTDSKF